MKITFLLPGYPWGPSGGLRVAYEYANHLVSRGHEVTLVHPRLLPDRPRDSSSPYRWLRAKIFGFRDWATKPTVDWHPIDDRVRLLFVPNAHPRNIPDADAIFATACFTVSPVLGYPRQKGAKFYLIQGYETWMKPKPFVDATWRSPLRKVVIARWLLELGQELGVADDLAYIPNAVDHDRYKCVTPIDNRPRQIAMLFSPVAVKGAADGIKALQMVRQHYPDIRVVFFGAGRRPSCVPAWIEYHRNPPQAFIVNEIYNRSSIFLNPSWSEGFGLPPAEAVCCGCALVATENDGVREYVQHEVTGLLSPVQDPAALAENICRLLCDDSLRVRLATAGRRELANFTWNRSTDLLENFIKSSLG